MSNAHISALETKHAELEAKIAGESHRPAPNEARLYSLKKRKLALKDEMMQIARLN